MRTLLMLLIFLCLLSCKKDELPITRADRGGAITQAIEMTSDYRYQLYYDLETNAVVGMNLKTDWDLGFQCEANEWQITINGAKYMAVWRTGQINFSNVTDTVNAHWQYDNVHGNLDSTAIGDWQITPQIYVVDRGYNWAGIHQGYFKMSVQNVTTTEYEIRVAGMNGAEDSVYIIPKNTDLNKTGFSFDSGSVDIEPPKADWDLQFTQYTHVFDDGQTYLVTGVLQNPYQTEVAQDNTYDFSSIVNTDLTHFSFSALLNTIGYDWKTYSFAISAFEIDTDITYVIETSDNRLFKLHFIDFYNHLGEKGHPTFEFQEI